KEPGVTGSLVVTGAVQGAVDRALQRVRVGGQVSGVDQEHVGHDAAAAAGFAGESGDADDGGRVSADALAAHQAAGGAQPVARFEQERLRAVHDGDFAVVHRAELVVRLAGEGHGASAAVSAGISTGSGGDVSRETSPIGATGVV